MATIEKWLDGQLPDMKKNMTVVRDIPFYHISFDAKIKKMRPRIGERQAKQEDRTIPRICGAPHLQGCILGHTGVMNAYDRKPGDDDSQWNGQMAIYEIKASGYIRPTKKLVFDVNETDEIWIVPFDPSVYELVPERIGWMYLSKTVVTREDGRVEYQNTFYVKLDKGTLMIGEKGYTKGYYAFEMNGPLVASFTKFDDDPYNVRQITASEWDNAVASFKKNTGG